jgi:mannose-6-phosphate isomerase
MERVWGGRGLEAKLGRTLPPGKIIGESWEIVDRPEARSVVVSGVYKDLTIRELLEFHGDEVMGPRFDSKKPFPVLIKWLDCQQKLSLQVHPPARVAKELGGEPKTENWYIADTEKGSEMIVGLKNGVTKEAFETALKNNELEPLVHRVSVAPGDSLFVWSGRLHAIGAGNLILEIQQNSDTTYRVYDWGRVGLDGQPRDLHIEESMRSIEFEDFEPEPIRNTQPGDMLVDCEEFRIRKSRVGAGKSLHFAGGTQPVLLNVITGKAEIHGSEVSYFEKGDTVLLPYAGEFEVRSTDGADLLITDQFI